MAKNEQTMEPAPQFFYTKDYPHRYTSGPILSTWHPDTHNPIASLGEAREIAERLKVGGYDESRVVTTYGMVYKTD